MWHPACQLHWEGKGLSHVGALRWRRRRRGEEDEGGPSPQFLSQGGQIGHAEVNLHLNYPQSPMIRAVGGGT